VSTDLQAVDGLSAISHIRRCGYHFGETPYGFKTVPASGNPRFRVMVENEGEGEQKVLMRIKSIMEEGYGISKLAAILSQDMTVPPQGKKGSKSLLYNLKLRKGWQVCRPVNARNHGDVEAKVRFRELRDRGTSYTAIAERAMRRFLRF
jgi:hypothetical protein